VCLYNFFRYPVATHGNSASNCIINNILIHVYGLVIRMCDAAIAGTDHVCSPSSPQPITRGRRHRRRSWSLMAADIARADHSWSPLSPKPITLGQLGRRHRFCRGRRSWSCKARISCITNPEQIDVHKWKITKKLQAVLVTIKPQRCYTGP
jgi:hypothetical protein